MLYIYIETNRPKIERSGSSWFPTFVSKIGPNDDEDKSLLVFGNTDFTSCMLASHEIIYLET